MYKLAVIGNPIAHSLSPTIFQLFARQSNIELSYDRILATDNSDFKHQVTTFFANGGISLNVTSPFKQEAYNYARAHTSRANFCHTTSILYGDTQGGYIADTLDGIALKNDLINNKHCSLSAKNILILGSGYVLESILLDFIVENPANIDILARNVARKEKLVCQFGVGEYSITRHYDIIINTVPNHVDNSLLAVCSGDNLECCYDLNYVKDSRFLQHMSKFGNNRVCHTGLGMLIEHNKIAFTRLFGGNNLDIMAVFSALTGSNV